MTRFGDPDLILAKTVAYELGYDHSLSDDFLFQVTAYYRDISNEQNATQYYSIRNWSYAQVTSTNYRDIRGFELTLRKTWGRFWTGFANYTYEVATTGHFGSANMYEDPTQQIKYNENTVTAYQARPIPRPYARANVTFFTPADFGPQWGFFSPLKDFTLNVLFNWQAGAWITWNPLDVRGIQNNAQQKDFFGLQLRIGKSFKLNQRELQFFVDIYNALNFKFMNLQNWGKALDQENYMNSLHLPKNPAYDNIPGDDKVGDYRKEGVAYQPVFSRGLIDLQNSTGEAGMIYYDMSRGKYMEYRNSAWAEVDKNRMDRILKDKAYIDMPNETSFTFLNPRQIFFGLRLSF